MSTKKKITTVLAALSLLSLAACDSDEMRYPSNYDDKLFDAVTDKSGNKVTTAMDTFKQYYQSLTNDDAIYEKAVNKLLTLLADNVHGIDDEGSNGDGSETYHVVNDVNDDVSVADSYDAATTHKLGDDKNSNLAFRAKDSLTSTAMGGSYEDDNVYVESKFAKYLRQNYYYLADSSDYKVTTDKESLTQKLLTPSMEYSDIYSTVNEKAYSKYMEEELYDDMKLNYLTAEYIYKKSYASIGNTNARKVQLIAITDRDDKIGNAKSLLDDYVDEYIMNKTGAHDNDFSKLSKLWKGITLESLAYLYGDIDSDGTYDITFTKSSDSYTYAFASTLDDTDKDELKEFFARYLVTLNDDLTVTIDPLSEVLTASDAAWLEDKKLVNNDTHTSDLLIGSIMADVKKLRDAEGSENWHKIDTSLESTYTGSYTYEIETGIRKAIDDLVTRNLITEGTYLKSNGISSLPSDLSDRIFSPKVSSSKSVIEDMKAKPGTKGDLTVYENDGFRYVTVADTITTNDNNIVYYDASSKTYYLTRILDVVDTSALNTANTNSIYYTTTGEKQKQIAMEVAYAMSTSGSYKSDSNVYWLSRLEFIYSDEDFLEYMKSNYKDIFKTESQYDGETPIDLNKLK